MRASIQWGWVAALCVCAPQLAQAEVRSSSVSAAATSTAIIEFIAGQLSEATDPQSLFEVSLVDEGAIELERARLELLLSTVDAKAGVRGKLREHAEPAGWAERIKLDRARLQYLRLPAPERARLLEEHARRRTAATRAVASEVQRMELLEAAVSRELQASRATQAEAQRIIEEERLRLAATATAVARSQAIFEAEREAVRARGAVALGWHHRALDARARGGHVADGVYDSLRVSLRSSRGELEQALAEARTATSAVPSLGPSLLDSAPASALADEDSQARHRLEEQVRQAKTEEQALRYARVEALLLEVRSLNDDRLMVLGALSADKRSSLTGFTTEALDQARAEARQLMLTLGYDRLAAERWLRALGASATSPWALLWGATPWLVLAVLGAWARKRLPAGAALARARFAEASSPAWVVGGLSFLQQVAPSIGRLIVFAGAVWLLPPGVRAVLEVELLTLVLGWILAGGLLIRAINALARAGASKAGDVEELRLRSLRLAGRVFIAFFLVRRVAAALVGEGTTYAWVGTLSKFGGLIVVLVLVHWWRDVVFTRLERRRRKSYLQRWVLDHRRGWMVFPAALVAISELVGSAVLRAGRHWLGRFALVRGGLAYLFKRELDRFAEAAPADHPSPLTPTQLATLSPDHASSTWVSCPADLQLSEILKRAAQGRGGAVAVVGPRGAGKTALIRQLESTRPDGLRLNGGDASTPDAIRQAMERAVGTPLVVWDDAHLLVKPILGGFAAFDRVLAHAYGPGSGTLWVLSLDSALWPLLRRARDARPLFEEIYALAPWSDAELSGLIDLRTGEAGLKASYEGLLDNLPASADEIEREDALAARRLGYLRLLGDYSRGNPGVALEAWRRSLTAPRGDEQRSLVRPLQVPPEHELEALPDAALFVLRAIIQLAPASLPDIAAATRLPESEVRATLEFGTSRSYLELIGGRVQICWPWLRPIHVLLERRHLVVTP